MKITNQNTHYSQQSFGMRVKTFGELADVQSTWSAEISKNFEKMASMLNKIEPDADTYIKLTPSKEVTIPPTKKVLLQLIVPFKDASGKWKQVAEDITEINSKNPALTFTKIVANHEFPYGMWDVAMALAEKYHSVT